MSPRARPVTCTGGCTWTRTFPRHLRAAAPARRFVKDVTSGHPAAWEALLVAGELIANSLVHAPDASTVTVAVMISGPGIRVDVYDNGTRGFPHLRDDGPDAEDGRGFRIINELATRWGFTRDLDRTCCWAEITTVPAA
jgi:serine/threonine-protein kinase RsbW